MGDNDKDISKRDLSPLSSVAFPDETNPLHSQKRVRLTSIAEDAEGCSSTSGCSPATQVPDTESPNSVCSSTSADAEPGHSLKSPSPEPSSSKLQPTDDSVSGTTRRFLAALNDGAPQAKRSIPRRYVLKSPTPSPEPAGESSTNHPAQDIADTDSTGASCESFETGSYRSASRTFSPDGESMLHMPRLPPTWPVNSSIPGEGESSYDLPEKLRDIGDRKPLFCCGDLHIHPRTNPIMPKKLEEIHGPIITVFVASINPEFEELTYLTDEELDAVNRIIKVNRIGAGVEISTFLFGINEKESTFMKILDSEHIMPFNPQGKGSYQSFVCPTHRNMYRIGVYDRKYSYLKKRVSFGDFTMDYSMGLLTDKTYGAEVDRARFQTFGGDDEDN